MEGLPNDALSCLLSCCLDINNTDNCVTRLRSVNRFFRLNVARWVIRQTMDAKNVKKFYLDFARMQVQQLKRKYRNSYFDPLLFASYLESTRFLPVFEQRVRTEPCAMSMLASFCLFITQHASGNLSTETEYRKVCVKVMRKNKHDLVPLKARFAHYRDTCAWLEDSWSLQIKKRDVDRMTKKVNRLKRELEAQKEGRSALEGTVKTLEEKINETTEKATKRAKRYEDELREKGAF